MLKVDFYSPFFVPECGLTYVIIGARYTNMWMFIKHKHRMSYELPAGHIKNTEDAGDAARREMEEETGALRYNIECIATYTVSEDGRLRAGRLYYAGIESVGNERDDSEIDEVILSSSLPPDLGFPDVQSVLFEYLEKYHAGQINSR